MESGDGGDWEAEGGIVNQGKLGAKAGIDTVEVQYWEMREVAGLQSTHVDFKNGITVILRGAAKVAFDKWAATLPMSGELADERREGEQNDDVHGWTPPPGKPGRVKPAQQGRIL